MEAKDQGRAKCSFVAVRMREGDEMLINIDAIACIHVPSETICICGMTGHGNGLLSLAQGEAERLAGLLKEADDE